MFYQNYLASEGILLGSKRRNMEFTNSLAVSDQVAMGRSGSGTGTDSDLGGGADRTDST
jgi:hypothetical protein